MWETNMMTPESYMYAPWREVYRTTVRGNPTWLHFDRVEEGHRRYYDHLWYHSIGAAARNFNMYLETGGALFLLKVSAFSPVAYSQDWVPLVLFAGDRLVLEVTTPANGETLLMYAVGRDYWITQNNKK